MYTFHQNFRAIVLIIFISVPNVFTANILFFHLFVSASHRISIWPLVEKLADAGHNVTYIYPMEQLGVEFNPKIEEIVPSKMIPILENFVIDFDINVRLNGSVNERYAQMLPISVSLCEAFYSSPETQQWLSKPNLHYDLILVDGFMGECAYGLIHKFNSKLIIVWPNGYGPWMWDGIGIVAESASIPDSMYSNTKPYQMDFFTNRLLSTFAIFLVRICQLEYIRQVKPIIQENLKISSEEMPSFLEIERNTSLILINAHFIEDYPVALPPLVQSYSGLWCSKEKLKARKPIPENLETFIGNHSVVYVSFGSAVTSSTMPQSLRDQFFQAFAEFPKLRFLWRWAGDGKNIPTNTPKNVLLQNWFPQKDLMADKRTKVFITQTGRISTQDALCHAVPIIAFPIAGDQLYNANRLEHVGAAIVLNIENVTTVDLQSALSEIINSDRYAVTMTKLSRLFRDRAIDPLENALYWTEYVLRHNTTHLKPLGMNRYWYERRLLDVYFFFGLSFVSVFLFMGCICQAFINCFLSTNKIKKD